MSYDPKKMSDKVVNRCFFVSDCIPDWFKTQEMCEMNCF